MRQKDEAIRYFLRHFLSDHPFNNRQTFLCELKMKGNKALNFKQTCNHLQNYWSQDRKSTQGTYLTNCRLNDKHFDVSKVHSKYCIFKLEISVKPPLDSALFLSSLCRNISGKAHHMNKKITG